MTSSGVSVIIPAYNAAKTIAETLESVCEQTFSNWEVIVINDGSSDETAAIVASFAKQDSRMRVVSQPHMGVSAARNTGIDLAQFDWLLFLDADDWILPLHLEQLTTILSSDPKQDAVRCCWMRVTSERKQYGPVVSSSFKDDLFPALAQSGPMAIHTCIVRRSLVQAVGSFNPMLRTCEDWDLWQRIARTGTHFSETSEVLAHYRIRTDSSSTNALQLLIDGFQVITQGHGPDPRVQNPHPDYVNGQPIDRLSSAKLNWLCYCAGLALGSGEDARPLLDWIQDIRNPELLSVGNVRSILYALPLPTCPPLSEYHKFWQNLEAPINDFLTALENHLSATGLVHRARPHMERIILEDAVKVRPVTVGNTHAIRVEVTEPIQDLLTPSSTERLHCTIELEGEWLGILELPVFDGIVFGRVLGDAIAAKFAWPILGRFFEHVIYPDFNIKKELEGLAIQRDNLCLADGLPEGEQFWTQAHEKVGWTVFLQEIWGYSDWSQNVFYQQNTVQKETTKRLVVNDCLVVEVSDELFDVEVSGNSLNIVVTVGGAVIGGFIMPVQSGIVSAQKLRSTILLESGFELCRAAVREGLLGRSLTEKIPLRDRLVEVTAKRRNQDNSEIEAFVPGLVSGTAKALNPILSLRKKAVVIGCRTMEPIGSSASRWAMLPTKAIDELTDAALVSNETLVQISPQLKQKLEWVLYTPDLILHSSITQWRSAMVTTTLDSFKVKCTKNHDRGVFETIYAINPDPWNYESPYEQTKYEQTLSLLPPVQIERALELACAEGLFTKQLAPLVDNLIAADISQIALNRAAERCTGLENISFMHLDFIKDPLPGCFDLIVCSEVLYFVGDKKDLQIVAHRFVDALKPGGYFLTAHANLVVDEPDRTGFNWDHHFGAKVIGETFNSIPALYLVKEIHTPLYRVQLFQRELHNGSAQERPLSEIIELPQPVLPIPSVVEEVLWQGGLPQRTTPKVSAITHTLELPILMYHRVAPSSSSKIPSLRVTLEAFEEQLRFLQDAEFYSISLEEWRVAMVAEKPLPGRAVLITFDDGYLDFFTYAWPLLKRYGFSAIVFLVADLVGKTNVWDSAYGEDIPLLNWEQIKQLQKEGVEFGSHSVSHRHLTSLSSVEIVREGVRSQTILQRELGVPIKAFAYPYGDVASVIEHLIGACGYVFGLSCQSGRSSFQDSLLALPRIEVEGSDSLDNFVKKLSPLKG
ncbi:hypothetical protein B4U84_28310 [Westiellopsis prolifica IICB1]|nr:hypothetical protein B4U84_28310 [Westiellopsis prolifica IICB1]